jgi:hypothetical protein
VSRHLLRPALASLRAKAAATSPYMIGTILTCDGGGRWVD